MKFVCKPNMALHLNRDLKAKSGLRELILSKSCFWRRREEKREKIARAREGSNFAWDCFPYLASKRSSNLQEKI